jgi:hypothetical protein
MTTALAILAALWAFVGFCWLALASVVLAALLYSAICENYERQRRRPSAWRRWRHCPKGDHRDTPYVLFGVFGYRCHDCTRFEELGACCPLMDCPRTRRSA